MSRLYVLGHTGFIGSALARRLQAMGADVAVAVASSAHCDLTDAKAVRSFLADMPPDSRLALCATVNKGVDNSPASLEANLRMVDNLATVLRDLRPGGLVFLSSVDVYGRAPALPVHEGTLPAPETYYGLSKLAGEFLLARDGGPGCPVAVLRLPGVYGPGDRGGSVVSRLARRILRGEPVRLEGGGGTLRDYVFIEDLTALVERLLLHPWHGMVNVATGASTSIRDLVDILAQCLGKEAVQETAPADSRAANNLAFNTAALQAAFPGMVSTDIREGAARTAAWLKKEYP